MGRDVSQTSESLSMLSAIDCGHLCKLCSAGARPSMRLPMGYVRSEAVGMHHPVTTRSGS